jgi:hypothetical protein
LIKNCNLPIPRPPLSTSKLQKKPSALKRGHPTLQTMNFYKNFLLLWVIFALLDPVPESESGSGSTDPIESGSNPDPQCWFCNKSDEGRGSEIWVFYIKNPLVLRQCPLPTAEEEIKTHPKTHTKGNVKYYLYTVYKV